LQIDVVENAWHDFIPDWNTVGVLRV